MNKKMKKSVFIISYIFNILLMLLFLVIILFAFLRFSSALDFIFFHEVALFLRMLMTIPVFILWVYCLILWGKFDKNITRLFLLLFLMAFYTPFFAYKALKNKWI